MDAARARRRGARLQLPAGARSRASGVDSICPRCQHRDAAAKSTESQTRARMGSTDGLINLSKGHPTEDLYAHAELSKAARAAADKMDSAEFSLDYGKEGASARFAAALSGLLAEEDAAATSPSAPSRAFDLSHRLFVTNGVSHALDVVAAVLARPGDRCLTEAATYFLVFALYTRARAHTMARSPLLCLPLVTSYSPNQYSWRQAVDIFRSHGLSVDAAPALADGSLDIDALARQLRDGSVRCPQLLYLCPVHSNPTGNTLCAEDRAKLVALASEYHFFIVADEVYHFLDWPCSSINGSAKPARMCAFDSAFLREGTATAALDVYSSSAPMASEGDGSRGPAPRAGDGDPVGGVVVSLSSFSKILGAGLRLGWIEAAPDIISALVTHPYVISGGGVAPFMGAFCTAAAQLSIQQELCAELCMERLTCVRLQNKLRAKSSRQATSGGFLSASWPCMLQN